MTSRARRAFTLAELTITTALVALVVGVLASLYFYALNRTTRGVAKAAAVLQAQMLLDRMEVQIAQACEADVVSTGGRVGLKLKMPASGSDRDSDGILDSYLPNAIDSSSELSFTRGKRVWYYMADASGDFATAGGYFHQAVRTDDNLPTPSDVVPGFTKTGGVYRYPLLDSVTFAVDMNELVSVAVRTSNIYRRDAAAGSTASESTDNSVITFRRQVYLRNWNL